MFIIKGIIIVFLALLDMGCIKFIFEKKDPVYAYWFWLVVITFLITLLLK